MEKKYILLELHATMKLKRMAYEILENNPGESELILAGIKDNGLAVAKQIQEILRQISPVTTQLLSLSFDKKKPAEITVSDKIDFNDKVIILVDDVANGGKALLYALKPFLQFYPRKIQTADAIAWD